MKPSIQRLLRAALLSAGLLLLANCGGHPGGSAESVPGSAPATAPSLPTIATLAGQVKQQPRRSSYVESDLTQKGSAFDGSLPSSHVLASGDLATFQPAYVAGAPLSTAAYALYRFSLPGYDRDAAVRTSWSLAPASFEHNYIALANWSSGRWDWYRDEADGEVSLPDIAPYFTPAGELIVAVLASGTGGELSSVRIGGLQPHVVVSATPSAGLPPFNVTIDASASSAGEGSITAFDWDCDGDGVYEASSAPPFNTLQHSYEDSGIYQARVRVTNSGGLSASASAPVRAVPHWAHSWGRGSFDAIEDLQVSADGDIYALGSSERPDFGINYEVMLLKVSALGELLWARSFSSGQDDMGLALDFDSQDNLIVAGRTTTNGNNDCLLQKWSPAGELLWSKRCGAGSFDLLRSVHYGDGQIYACGSSDQSGSGTDFLVLCFNTDGQLQWSRRRDGASGLDSAEDCALTHGLLGDVNGLLVYGTEHEGATNTPWLLQYDSDGAFNSGRKLQVTLTTQGTGKGILYHRGLLSGDTEYVLAGEVVDSLLGDTYSYLISMPESGSANFVGSFLSAGTTYDLVPGNSDNYILAGYTIDNAENAGLASSFDRLTGGLIGDAPLLLGSPGARLYAASAFEGGVVYGGYTPNALPDWQGLSGGSLAAAASWGSFFGSGADLQWSSSERGGAVSDITGELVVDSGAGTDDAFMAYRAEPQ